jgi:hypothetical protein
MHNDKNRGKNESVISKNKAFVKYTIHNTRKKGYKQEPGNNKVSTLHTSYKDPGIK